MEFTRRPIPSDLAINLNGTQLRKVKEQRHLGLILSSDLRWTEHTNRVLSKAARLLHTLRRLRNSLSRQALLFYYCLYIRPVIEYASVAWPKLPAHLRDRRPGAISAACAQDNYPQAHLPALWPQRSTAHPESGVSAVPQALPVSTCRLSPGKPNGPTTPPGGLLPARKRWSLSSPP